MLQKVESEYKRTFDCREQNWDIAGARMFAGTECVKNHYTRAASLSTELFLV